MNKFLLAGCAIFTFSLSILPQSALGYYELSNSKVNAETRLGTFSKILKPQTEAVLQLSDLPGWYPADNTNPQVAEMDFVEKNLVVFTALKAGITSSRICNDYTTDCITVLITVTADEAYTQHKPSLHNGQLALDGTTVYMIYKNTKTAFTNYPAFTGLGFKLSQISFKGNLSHIPDSGYVIERATDWHPWGSWVKQGEQIYLVHELGLMPIANMEIFTNNYGSIKMLVNLNTKDQELARIAPMTLNDWRLN